MENCPCRRKVLVPPSFSSSSTSTSTDGVEYNASDTTCSRDAFLRGGGQKVVGFSFYGDRDQEHAKKKGYFQVRSVSREISLNSYPQILITSFLARRRALWETWS